MDSWLHALEAIALLVLTVLQQRARIDARTQHEELPTTIDKAIRNSLRPPADDATPCTHPRRERWTGNRQWCERCGAIQMQDGEWKAPGNGRVAVRIEE